MLSAIVHADEARRSANLMAQNFADDKLLQASNQAWHATKHAINAAAVSRGRTPVTYQAKKFFLQELAEEPGNQIFWDWMRPPWRLHGNLDRGFMTSYQVADAVEITGMLVNRLLAIAGHP
ncbi:MAG: hypothetical protein OXI54_01660 [Chloroflexota bacterium]|nr:hypothetical protein [Chloroflexota bacterium]MDE2682841.1 hypothetical protein [Chloroflexota bacterium]